MTAGPSGVETPPTSSETLNEKEVGPEEKSVPVEQPVPPVENQETDLNVTSSNIEAEEEPVAVSDKTEDAAEVVTTTATPSTPPATPNLNKTAEEPEIPSFR